MKNILILGGAGFIGSNLAELFLKKGYNVTVIDGLLNNSGGRIDNISSFIREIDFINERIEDVNNLSGILNKNEIIIDSMAWTCHLSAIKDPFYDLDLNVRSHLYFLEQIKKYEIKPEKIIYLGSRTQYGNPLQNEINEETPMNPLDIQGIHKLTSENYYRIFTDICGLNVISIRMIGVFGRNQPFEREDLGLVGNLIRDGLNNKEITVYGEGRQREIVYVDDLVNIIFKVTQKKFNGFNAFNVGGEVISIEKVGKKLIKIIGKGSVIYKKLPKNIENIDIKNYIFNVDKIKSKIGDIILSDIDESLKCTIDYFKKKLTIV